MLLQCAVGVDKSVIAPHLEGNVGYSNGLGRPPGSSRVLVLSHVDGVEVLSQGHEEIAVVGILLGDAKPEDVTVERLGPLKVRHPQLHMTDLLEPDRGTHPPSLPRVTLPQPRPEPKAASPVLASPVVPTRCSGGHDGNVPTLYGH